MTPKIEDLCCDVSGMLKSNELPSEEKLLRIVTHTAESRTLVHGVEYSEDEIRVAARHLMETHAIEMDDGTMLPGERYRPWLNEAKTVRIKPFYWSRYRTLLEKRNFPGKVVTRLDRKTDEILDHLEDPLKEGSWKRKGMVVGHVQSGKTANYTGVICKAADSGYRVIIVLAGILNSLRSQTQERIDEGFLGFDSETKSSMGVGLLPPLSNRRPACFTTRTTDFDIGVANKTALTLQSLSEPAIFVIKKNKRSIENLHEWLRVNNPHQLKDHAMLLIDDEADHASVNTSKNGRDATAINAGIRSLLKLFPRSSYLGYTATPFANIFIDPESTNEMIGDDLFPEDFILNLDAPTNYFGASRIFGDEEGNQYLRVIEDNGDTIPIRHDKYLDPAALPESLKRAIGVYFLGRTLRLHRGHLRCHSSMMINCSRFTDVQNRLADLVGVEVDSLKKAIMNNASLPVADALQNSRIRELHKVWQDEFSHGECTWPEIQESLTEATASIEVMRINQRSPDKLDYSRKNFPSGRHVIAVGGIGLSRGLTLEGLLVSYFLRNSIMYDTLLQMGRWFGYRDGYDDLCRIWMQQDAIDWYAHISNALDELRSDLDRMARAGATPATFGLKVRNHPNTLIVTARNKMRSAESLPRSIELDGHLVETSTLYSGPSRTERNFRALEILVHELEARGTPVTDASLMHGPDLGHFYCDVPSEVVLDFIRAFDNHPGSQMTEAEPLSEQITKMKRDGQDRWDVLIRSPGKEFEVNKGRRIGNLEISQSERKAEKGVRENVEPFYRINRNRVGSRGDEKAGLDPHTVTAIRKRREKQQVPDKDFRNASGKRPLLLVYLVRIKNETALLPAFGMSFPGATDARRPVRTVTYRVNLVFWRNYVGSIEIDEDEEATDE